MSETWLGRGLTTAQLNRAARAEATLAVWPDAMARVEAAHRAIGSAATRRPVYGTTTGVGANRTVDVAAADHSGQGRRLLRSHCAGGGPGEPPDVVRAMMVVRLDQLLAGASGIDPAIVTALAAAVSSGARLAVHRYGAIGTGDLCALAELGLTLAGERPWAAGDVPAVDFSATDALALMSSNALTIGIASLALGDLDRLVWAAGVVAALVFLALRGSTEAYAEAVQLARPHPGQVAVAAAMRGLLGVSTVAPARVQDPFGLRTLPQVHGAAVGAAADLDMVLGREIGAGAENPMVVGDRVLHHGNFHTAELAGGLDSFRGAVAALASLSVARLSALLDPHLTDLPPFLAVGPPGSSGLMMLEYTAHDALAELRARAHPTATGSAVLSRGTEEHASFSTQGARRAAEMVEPLGMVLACELVAATRALRLAPERLGDAPVRAFFDRAADVLDASTGDRPLVDDLAGAVELLHSLADVADR